MADTLVSEFKTIGSTAEQVLFTAGNWVTTVLSITICDNSTNGNTFDLYIDPSGTSSTGDNSGNDVYIYKGQTLGNAGTFEHTDKIVLHANDQLHIRTPNSSNQICTTVSFLKQTS